MDRQAQFSTTEKRGHVWLMVFAFALSVACFACAQTLHAQTVEIGERMGRVEERVEAVQTIHVNDVAAIRASLLQHSMAITQRLEIIEKYLFWLFGVTGGVGLVVGGDVGFRLKGGLRQ